jgi:hypothetical protein
MEKEEKIMNRISLKYIIICGFLLFSFVQANRDGDNPSVKVHLDLIQNENEIRVVGDVTSTIDSAGVRIKVYILRSDRSLVHTLFDSTLNLQTANTMTLKDMNNGEDITFSTEYLYGGYIVLVQINGGNPPLDSARTEKNFQTEADIIQPELSEEGFIELVNNILVDKVSLEMFDISENRYIYIRNTYDHNEQKINITIRRVGTDINIYVDNGHFSGIPQEPQSTPSPTEEPITPQMIDVRGLFTPQIESQVDLTPPSTFKETRRYDISVMGYKGTLEMWRGHVSIYFKNIGGLSPTPTYPTPTGNAIYYLLGGFLAILLVIAILVVLVWRKWRKKQ